MVVHAFNPRKSEAGGFLWIQVCISVPGQPELPGETETKTKQTFNLKEPRRLGDLHFFERWKLHDLCWCPGFVCMCKEQSKEKKSYRHKWFMSQGKILWLRIKLFLFSSGVSLTARYLQIWMLRKHFLYSFFFFLHLILAKRPKSNYSFLSCFAFCFFRFVLAFSYASAWFLCTNIYVYTHIYTYTYLYVCIHSYDNRKSCTLKSTLCIVLFPLFQTLAFWLLFTWKDFGRGTSFFAIYI